MQKRSSIVVETVILQFRVDAVGFLTCCFESVRHNVGEMTRANIINSIQSSLRHSMHFSYVASRNIQNNWMGSWIEIGKYFFKTRKKLYNYEAWKPPTVFN